MGLQVIFPGVSLCNEEEHFVFQVFLFFWLVLFFYYCLFNMEEIIVVYLVQEGLLLFI